LSADFPLGISDPLERLRVFFHNRTRTILVHPDVSRLLRSDHLAQCGGPSHARRLREFKRRSRAFVSRCLREAKQSKILPGTISTEAGAVIVLGAILSLSHARIRVVHNARIEALSDEVWLAIERILRGDGPSLRLEE
jgi:hypothetical protein